MQIVKTKLAQMILFIRIPNSIVLLFKIKNKISLNFLIKISIRKLVFVIGKNSNEIRLNRATNQMLIKRISCNHRNYYLTLIHDYFFS